MFFGGLKYVSGALTPLLVPKPSIEPVVLDKTGDFLICGGKGRVPGTVKRDADPTDLPLRRRVRLIREIDGRVIRETWSDAATGEYLFTGVSEHETYTIISYDHEHNYRAVVADNITPEVAP